MHRECSTHYHMIALRSFVGLRENARRPASPSRRLRRAPRPRRRVRPALLPARRHDPGALGRRHRRLHATLLELLGVEPADEGASFPDGGYFTQRGDDRFLIFDCGPLGDGGHGHYDLLSFEACAGGRPLVVDPGRYTYAEGEPNLRHWFKGTAAHNTVCVDGLDQTPYARKAPKGPTAEPRFLGRTERRARRARRAARPTRPSTAAGSRSSTTATG